MTWNHRVLAHKHVDDEVYFQVHEVNYCKEGKPVGYSENSISLEGEDIASIKWTLNYVNKSLLKPILWAGERFPEKVITIHKCLLCGRDNFKVKFPHNCGKTYRKRNLKWETKYI